MLRLRDIMTRDVVVVFSDAPLRSALELFAKHHITGAPVVDGDAVVGVVSAADLLTFAATLTTAEPEPTAEAQAAKPWDGGESTISTRLFVPGGTPFHDSGGETSSPSQV